MKKIKRVFLVLLTLITLFNVSMRSQAFDCYTKIINKATKNYIKILQTDKVTNKVLTNRKDKYIVIEIIVGKVINNKKDGKILNTKDTYYNYISYNGIKGLKKGDKVLTICVFANNNYEDDIAFRFDKKIKGIK